MELTPNNSRELSKTKVGCEYRNELVLLIYFWSDQNKVLCNRQKIYTN